MTTSESSMTKETPIFAGEALLQKYPCKGGWTYIDVPNVKPNKNNPFGWLKVKGQIDDRANALK